MELALIQENWQWLFALGCLALYLWDKNKSKDTKDPGEPKSKIEEIGEKAEAILKEKAEDFVEDVEEEVLESLEEQADKVHDALIGKLKEEMEKFSEPEPEVQPAPEPEVPGGMKNWDETKPVNAFYGWPNPALVSKARTCMCGSEKLYKFCHGSKWTAE
jgi:hypothetical protein